MLSIIWLKGSLMLETSIKRAIINIILPEVNSNEKSLSVVNKEKFVCIK